MNCEPDGPPSRARGRVVTSYSAPARSAPRLAVASYVLFSAAIAMPAAVLLTGHPVGAIAIASAAALACSAILPVGRSIAARRYEGCRIELDLARRTLSLERVPRSGTRNLCSRRVSRSVPIDQVQRVRANGASIWARMTLVVAEPGRRPERFSLPPSTDMDNWGCFVMALRSEFADRVVVRWVDRPLGIVLVLLGALLAATIITVVISLLTKWP
jgi:hypothetical protein